MSNLLTPTPRPAVAVPPADGGDPGAGGEGGDLGPQAGESWGRALRQAIRSADELVDFLCLPESLRDGARRSARLFPLLVPQGFARLMERGNPHDPLLRQVLPLADEETSQVEGTLDAVGDGAARRAPGLIHKYAGRVLLIATGSCAVHCRYCFRRHYPYGDEPGRLRDWEPALQYLRSDETVSEVLLSGGDPLMATDARLFDLLERIEAIPHVRRIRLHSRLPIVLPERMTPDLVDRLRRSPKKIVLVVHANHPRELDGGCEQALRKTSSEGLLVLNQSVLLRGVNDSADTLAALSERLVDAGILPYYLHQLDRVAGTLHFEVPEAVGHRILTELRARLPGYAVPRYVREISGEPCKTELRPDL